LKNPKPLNPKKKKRTRRADLVVTFPSQLTKAKSKAVLIEIKYETDGERGKTKFSSQQAYFAINKKGCRLTKLSDWMLDHRNKTQQQCIEPQKEIYGGNMNMRYAEFADFLDAADQHVEAAGCFGIDFRFDNTRTYLPLVT
jgi:hypothetical protein